MIIFLDQVIDYKVINYEILIQFIRFMIYFNMKIKIVYLYLFINYPSGWVISKIVIYNTMQFVTICIFEKKN
jgi:ATP-dependent protease ClpP protease subunit